MAFYLLLLLSSLYSVQAGWVCPNAPLDDSNPSIWHFPPDYNSSYPSGMSCTINIAVKKGQYLDVYFDNVQIAAGDNFTVYDETGNTYNSLTTGFPLKFVVTGVNLYINVKTHSTGLFSFTYHILPLVQPTVYLSATITNGQPFVLDLENRQYNSSAIIMSDSPIAILGDWQNTYDMIDSQNVLIYGGDAINGTYLGSVYSFYNTNRVLFWNKAPYKVTVIQMYNGFDAALLFRSANSIKNIDYSFFLEGVNQNSRTLGLRSKGKPAVVTVFNRDIQYNWVYALSSTADQVDWLPGGTVPPAVPNLSFNNSDDFKNVAQRIPGFLNTFSTNSSSATLFIFRNWPRELSSLNASNYGYVPSLNYNLPNSQQNLSTDFAVTQTSNVTFTVINCYNYFSVVNELAFLSGTNKTTYNMTTGSMTLLLNSFTVTYVEAGTDKDTGGLMKFEVLPPPKASSQQFIWTLNIAAILNLAR